VIFFEVDPKLCIKRCDSREAHPTVKRGEGKKVVGFMKRNFKPPNPRSEGFRNLFLVKGERGEGGRRAREYILGLVDR